MVLSSKWVRQLFLSFAVFSVMLLVPYAPGFSQGVPEGPSAVTLAQTAVAPIAVQQVATVGMTVSDMDRVLPFYTDVLGFQKISDIEASGAAYEQLEGVRGARMRVVQVQLGSEAIELTDYLNAEGRPIPLDSRSNDHWFQHVAIVVSDMDAAYQRLREAKVQFVSNMPQTLPDYLTAAAGIKAFYFQDPDRHNLEVIYFPPGKGDPRWQEPTDQVFLGIDHTAIATADTDTSLGFYRDLLGLRAAGKSENYGTEQEHLNNVFGAHLQITGLRAPAGPGVEFLDYLSPPGGRPIPADLQANDLAQWQTTLIVANAETAAGQLRRAGYDPISNSVATLPSSQIGFAKAFLVHDPDGHVIRIVEK
ncbi:VOC family protein [Nodosilinea nodulosa]|uniref:VOC family protein n=1 Tax=Nodosilinea nodulosa TaxID=416001 RepID=UPI00031FA9A7|nr:VOC family protein [Nodosilinea nodulosa]